MACLEYTSISCQIILLLNVRIDTLALNQIRFKNTGVGPPKTAEFRTRGFTTCTMRRKLQIHKRFVCVRAGETSAAYLRVVINPPNRHCSKLSKVVERYAEYVITLRRHWYTNGDVFSVQSARLRFRPHVVCDPDLSLALITSVSRYSVSVQPIQTHFDVVFQISSSDYESRTGVNAHGQHGPEFTYRNVML